MKYIISIAGITEGTYNTKEEAEKRLNEIRHSFLALVHPIDCIYIKEIKD